MKPNLRRLDNLSQSCSGTRCRRTIMTVDELTMSMQRTASSERRQLGSLFWRVTGCRSIVMSFWPCGFRVQTRR
jgi:hypothetical protein